MRREREKERERVSGSVAGCWWAPAALLLASLKT